MKTPFALILTCAVSIGIGYAQTKASEESALRSFIQNLAELRNAHEGTAIAKMYASDGRYIAANGITFKGFAELQSMWNTQPGKAARTIKSIELVTSDIAVVRALVTFDFTSVPIRG
jgi:ketosteroid isomerase-like protein